MSRAAKHREKEIRRIKRGKQLPIYCTNCNVELAKSVYDMSKPWEYVCPMCGKLAFGALAERMQLNDDFNLFKEVAEIQENNT